ncbi:hypothetical protein K0M31_020315 [Melipona bicolor]|uniref:Uncharacterized protein n=1 Tax=Melipona bicolor TaxID=60889 RepID=A0AA40G1B7_9HYME|nr:hypothetical protein K0M31_020315 [Melipona bicolor]
MVLETLLMDKGAEQSPWDELFKKCSSLVDNARSIVRGVLKLCSSPAPATYVAPQAVVLAR